MTVKVRYAPSPTGPLHIGGARTVLFNWLYARQNQGVMLVRSEDTDLERSDVKWEKEIGEALLWLGLSWDEGIIVGGERGPYRQTERLGSYQEYLAKLWLGGHVYYCFCTPEELEARRAESQQEQGGYNGRCRHLTPTEAQVKLDAGLRPAIRFKVPVDREVIFQDLIRGEVRVSTKDVSDFVIIKQDGIPTYNYAVVIDDITMKVTHIIRANEHLTNTPKQVLIYEALGEFMPEFAHVSLILDETGRKMSKRMGDMSVAAYIRRGYLPEAVVNFLALLGWSPQEPKEIFTTEELIAQFSLDRVSKSPAIFDFQKLDWMNNQYIMQSELPRLVELAVPVLEGQGVAASGFDKEWLGLVISVVRDELNNLSELGNFIAEFSADEVSLEEDAREHLAYQCTPAVLDEFVRRLEALSSVDQESVSALLKQLNKDLKAQMGVSGKLVFMPVRVALSGTTSGQELYHLVPLLGRERALKRIKHIRQLARV
jgi:nondiscriminating glutamyl-tRNA synthetase